jgi:hypothetical protein
MECDEFGYPAVTEHAVYFNMSFWRNAWDYSKVTQYCDAAYVVK